MISPDINAKYGQVIRQGKCQPYECYKTFLIHVPKCGGSSIKHVLQNKAGYVVHGHTSALGYKQTHPALFDKYYKFAFIRNPFDRLVSVYHFSKRVQERAFRVNLDASKTFGAFVDKVCEHFNKLMCCEVLCPQVTFITDEMGSVVVDDLFLFEDMDWAWSIISKKIGCMEPLGHRNKTNHEPYMHYYTDELKSKVYGLYYEDFQLYERIVADDMRMKSDISLDLISRGLDG